MKSGRNHLPILDIGGGEDEDRVLAEALSDWREVEMRRRRILQTRLKGKMTEHYSKCKMEAGREGGQKNVWTGQ